jgi:hypothetical protein
VDVVRVQVPSRTAFQATEIIALKHFPSKISGDRFLARWFLFYLWLYQVVANGSVPMHDRPDVRHHLGAFIAYTKG